ncbi:5239_t:CDS:1 [Paraglomus brasilianum]|uniref:5239_t:CDS:1 n=1 Tax=Paraglomus brasilianum TaxID=144538 RepID=A0A9N9GRN5_9GLOM|nr:5239_t:CDS:1 [Paraglomus brasilianum]
MVKRMRSDAVPLSPEDYKFIIQYRDTKPKTEVLKELRKKYPMTNNRFYRIWRGQEVSMIEWYQPISDSIAPLNQDLSIPESHLPNIGQVNIAENSNRQTSAFETHQINKDILLQSNGSSNLHLDSNVTSDKRVKNRKLRSKSVRISDLPNVINGVDTVNKLTKKVGGKDDMYTLIERERREAEEAERESERFLNLN